jgi:hypothetical protein
MKSAHTGTSFVILFAVALTSACAAEVSEEGADGVVVESETTPVGRSDDRGGSSECMPLFGADALGNPYVSEIVCPLPTRPSPDPEQTRLENLDGEWVSGETTQNDVH